MFNGKEIRDLRSRLVDTEYKIKKLKECINNLELVLVDTGILETVSHFYFQRESVYKSNPRFNAYKLMEYLGIELKETPANKEYVKKGKSK